MLEDGAWLRHATRMNTLASTLAADLQQIPGVKLLAPVQANAVFVELPGSAMNSLRDRGWLFYTFIGKGGVRLMCSWDTTEEDISSLVSEISDLASS